MTAEQVNVILHKDVIREEILSNPYNMVKETYIDWWLNQGYDIRPFIFEDFNLQQFEQILRGVKLGLDVSKYASADFSDAQMREIIEGLEHNLDVTKYNNPKYSYKKMAILRSGLQWNIDLSDKVDEKTSEDEVRQLLNAEIFKMVQRTGT